MDYHWEQTLEITQKLTQIEALKIVVSQYPPNPERLSSLRRQNLLKSAVYSARIENIKAQINDPRVHRQLEIQNLLRGYQQAARKQVLSLSLIKNFHKLVLKNISPYAGSFRTEPWAIYNQAGIAVYLAPLHTQLPILMSDYVSYVKSLNIPTPVVSAIAQFIFEKIHPFADGNGRVGRLISYHLLNASGYDFSGLSVFEEYTDKNRDLYYEALTPNNNMTLFINYFLDSIISSVHDSLEILKNPDTGSGLLPRRQEILDIIADHPQCSFDFIHRRFSGIPKSTLHFDLQQLQKSHLLIKHGTSRGSVYSAK